MWCWFTNQFGIQYGAPPQSDRYIQVLRVSAHCISPRLKTTEQTWENEGHRRKRETEQEIHFSVVTFILFVWGVVMEGAFKIRKIWNNTCPTRRGGEYLGKNQN